VSTADIDERIKTIKTLKEQMAACAAAGRKAEELLAAQAVPATKQMLTLARLKQQAEMAKQQGRTR
jgi:hypothetical protein